MDPDREEALALWEAYRSTILDWEERVVASEDFALPTDDPRRAAAKEAFQAELDALHEQYCRPSEWTEHFMVSSPSVSIWK